MKRFLLDKAEHLTDKLQGAIHGAYVEIPRFRVSETDDFAFAEPDYPDEGWPELTVDQQWGASNVVRWFRAKVAIPEEMRGQPLDLILRPGPRLDNDTAAEALLYLNGTEAHGLDQWHSEVRLSAAQSHAETLSVAMRAWSGMACRYRIFDEARLAVVDEAAERLYYLLRASVQTLRELEADSTAHIALLQLTDETLRMIDFVRQGEPAYERSLNDAYAHMRQGLSAASFPETCRVALCGHSHIDMAWLWQLEHTCDKASRTFSTVLALMDRYPDYVYSQSSPYLYEQVARKYPRLFERVRQHIKEGRWEITGGMWVEPDTNLPSGESLVRQILLGKGYMRSQFGVDCTVLWLPDVFGYSWTLPQLLKKSGIRYMWTNKMSWNQYNRFPYDTFKWRGMDGSEVLVQLGSCPEKNVPWGATYNGIIAPWEVKGTWKQYAQKDINSEVLMPFGWGDGGGGPTKEMLAAYPAVQQMPGLPSVEMKTVTAFFEEMEQRLEEKRVPVWEGEMYFEYHRGTYTAQGFIKAANRRAETLLHNTEWLHATGDIALGQSEYPFERLTEVWKTLCLNQFHDIIPGSSIHAVYDDARADHRRIAREASALCQQGVQRLGEAIAAPEAGWIVFNPLGFARGGVATLALPAGHTLAWQGQPLPAQPTDSGEQPAVAVLLPEMPAMGWRALALCPAERGEEMARVLEDGLETERYRIRWNKHGQLCEVLDKRSDRQLLRPGELGNELQVFEDDPHAFSAWNTEAYAYDKVLPVTELESVEWLENGAVRACVRFTWRFHHSHITQVLTVYRDMDGIRFDTQCDWHEPDTLLKTCFPLDIHSTKATYDIQFGNVERATHENTSWEIAQFEVCAHKWMDLSEGDYGAAMLNDCKYGCDIKNGNMRLTLLKAPTYPDETADIGAHRFAYCLLPHRGGWREADIPHAAYAFNDGFIAAEASGGADGILPGEYSLASVDAPGIMVETVKRAEDGDGWILRLYEYQQCHRAALLRLGFAPRQAWECDLLEQPLAGLDITADGVPLRFTPYEIKTIRVR